MDDGERFAPVALAAEEPVTEFVFDRFFALVAGGEPGGGGGFGLGDGHAVEVESVGIGGVDEFTFAGPACFTCEYGFDVGIFGGGSLGIRCDDALDRDVENLSEFKVAGIVSRNRHDGAGAVAYQHIVGDPDGDFFCVDRIDGISTGENPVSYSVRKQN